MRPLQDGDHLIPICLATSILFGVVHLSNVVGGASLSATLVQVLFACCFGFLFCAMFFYTGSILPTMLLHFLHDFLCFIANTGETGVLQTSGARLIDIVVNLGVSLVFILLALWILNKKNRPRIVAMWREKWGMEASE